MQEAGKPDRYYKAGFLAKKGKRSNSWKKRWFVLRSTQLAYYKNSKEYQVLNVFNLAQIRSVHYSRYNSKHAHCIFIVSTPVSKVTGGSAENSNYGDSAPGSASFDTTVPYLSVATSGSAVVPGVSNTLVSPLFAAKLQDRNKSGCLVSVLDAGTYEDAQFWIGSLSAAIGNLRADLLLDLSLTSQSRHDAPPSVSAASGATPSSPRVTPFVNPIDTVVASSSSAQATKNRNAALGVFVITDNERKWWQAAIEQLHPGVKIVAAKQSAVESISFAATVTLVDSPVQSQSALAPSPLSKSRQNTLTADAPKLEELRETTSEEEESSDEEEEEMTPLPPSSLGISPLTTLARSQLLLSGDSSALTQLNSPFLTPLANQIPSHSSYLHLLKNDTANKEWSRRWFVLRGNNLMTYRDHSEYEVLKIISIEEVLDIVPYGREHDIIKLNNRQQKNEKGKDKLYDDTMVPLTLVSNMLNDFCAVVKSNESGVPLNIDEVKNAVWAEFTAKIKESVLYAMEIIFVDRSITLATSRFDLYESWILAFMRGYLSTHSF